MSKYERAQAAAAALDPWQLLGCAREAMQNIEPSWLGSATADIDLLEERVREGLAAVSEGMEPDAESLTHALINTAQDSADKTVGARLLSARVVALLETTAIASSGWMGTGGAVRRQLGGSGLWAYAAPKPEHGQLYLDIGIYLGPPPDGVRVVWSDEIDPDIARHTLATRAGDRALANATERALLPVDGIEAWFERNRASILPRAAAALKSAGAETLDALATTQAAGAMALMGTGQDVPTVAAMLVPFGRPPFETRIAKTSEPFADALGCADAELSGVMWSSSVEGCAIVFATVTDAHKTGHPANRALLNDMTAPTGDVYAPQREADLICDILYGDAVVAAWNLRENLPVDLTQADIRKVSRALADTTSGRVAEAIIRSGRGHRLVHDSEVHTPTGREVLNMRIGERGTRGRRTRKDRRGPRSSLNEHR